MHINKIITIPIIAISCFAISCGGNKKLSKKDTPSTVLNQNLPPEQFINLGINYKSFNGKASINVPFEDKEQKLTLNLKMNKNKNIWGMASAMSGIVEVARGFATPDSLQSYISLNKSAYALSFEEGVKLLGAEIEFTTLQNLFIGNPLITDNKNLITDNQSEEIIVSQKKGDDEITIIFDKASQTIKQQTVVNKAKNTTIHIEQSNYKPLADMQPFAYQRIIKITQNNAVNIISLDFSRAEIDVPADVNFKIPDNYSIKKIK
jgi:hypothetical protein